MKGRVSPERPARLQEDSRIRCASRLPIVALLAAAGAAVAGAAVAGAAVGGAKDRPQNHRPAVGRGGNMVHQMPAQMPMMPGGPPAAHVVQLREMLGLSDDQVKRLETLAASQRTTLEPNRGAMLRAL